MNVFVFIVSIVCLFVFLDIIVSIKYHKLRIYLFPLPLVSFLIFYNYLKTNVRPDDNRSFIKYVIPLLLDIIFFLFNISDINDS